MCSKADLTGVALLLYVLLVVMVAFLSSTFLAVFGFICLVSSDCFILGVCDFYLKVQRILSQSDFMFKLANEISNH